MTFNYFVKNWSMESIRPEITTSTAVSIFNDTRQLCDHVYDNDEDEESDPRWTSYAYVVNGFVLFVVILVGAVGNVMCLAAFRLRGGVRICPRINYYLIALSSWDLCLVLSSFCLYTLPHLIYGRLLMSGRIVIMYPFVYVLACSAHLASIWVVVSLALDRYFALCHPLMHRVYSSRRVTVLVLCACGVASVLFNIPKYLEITVSECYESTSPNAEFTYEAVASGLRSDPIYWTTYKVVGGLALFSLGPFFTLSFLSIRVWCKVRRLTTVLFVNTPPTSAAASAHHRPQHHLELESLCMKSSDPPSAAHHSSHHQPHRPKHLLKNENSYGSANGSPISAAVAALRKRSSEYNPAKASVRALRRHSSCQETARESQHAVNSMLFSVLFKFLLCHSLPTILDVCESVMNTETFHSPWISRLVDTSNLLVVTNSSLNFVIYLACSRRFRNEVVDLLPNVITRKHRRRRTQLTRCRRCTIATCVFHKKTTCPHFNHYFLQQTQDQYDFSVSVAKQSAIILSSAGLTFVDRKLLAAYALPQ